MTTLHSSQPPPTSIGDVSTTRRLILFVTFVVAAMTGHAQKTFRGDGIDDWLRFVPIATAVGLKACGVESSSTWKRFAVNSAVSITLSSGVTWGLKHLVNERRPDHTDRHSFPSGHTGMAFVGAAILDKEFRHVSPWISVSGYAVAATVAVDRVVRHRHHWHDVAVGAGLGIGGTLLGYYLGDKMTGERSRYAVGVGAEGVVVRVNF